MGISIVLQSRLNGLLDGKVGSDALVIGYIDALFPLDCGLRGSNYFARTGLYLLLPVLFTPIAMTYIFVRRKCSRKTKKGPKSTSVVPMDSSGPNEASKEEAVSQNPDDVTLRMKLETLVVISSIILHPSLTKRALSLFSCRSVYLFNPETRVDEKAYFLAADTSVPCHTTSHVMWQLRSGIGGNLSEFLGKQL
jgi:hypothetical protein